MPAVEEALRIHPTWINGGIELPGQGGSVVAAMLAVAAGLCRHVLCFRTVWESTHAELQRSRRVRRSVTAGGRVGGDMQWRLPFGAMSAANWIGDERVAALRPLRHDARGARVDRAERPAPTRR